MLGRGQEQGGSGVAGVHDMHVRQQLPLCQDLMDQLVISVSATTEWVVAT